MTTKSHFSDEELTAYLDGELESADALALETELAKNADLAARLAALDVNKSDLGTAFDILGEAAPQMPPLPETGAANKPETLSVKRSFGAMAALPLFLCLCLGLLGGYLFANQQNGHSQPWHDYVASYQALYVNGTLSNVEFQKAEAETDLQRISQALGKDLNFEALVNVSQLDYKRGQILGFNGNPLIQLAFLSKTGDPVALCIIKASDDSKSEIVTGQMENMKSAHWQKDGYAFLLIGGQDSHLIKMAAAQFSAEL